MDLTTKQQRNRISNRQRAVLSCLATSLTYEEIAEQLHMSPNTVSSHRRKLGLALHVADGNMERD